MRVVVFGGTGMVGYGVLLEALDSPDVDEVISVGRNDVEVEHPKLRQITHRDFLDFEPIADDLTEVDAVLWCLGVSSAGMDEEPYSRITHDFTMAAAKVLHERSPDLTFCFVSGDGTDADARAMWRRVKGKAERALDEVGFRSVVHFRPAFIKPMRGAKLRVPLYRVAYAVLAPLGWLMRGVGKGTSTVEVGRAMVAAALGRAEGSPLDSRAINELAKKF